MRLRAVILAGAIVAVAAGPASAGVTGTVKFECWATLPQWSSPGAVGDCGDTVVAPSISVRAVGIVDASGTDDWGTPYTVAGQGPFYAEFDYSNGCVANEPPLLGTAHGTATVWDLPAVRNGAPTTATLQMPFTWTRVGTTALITISGPRLHFADGATASGQLGEGQAAFVPWNRGFCPSGGKVNASVVGEANLFL